MSARVVKLILVLDERLLGKGVEGDPMRRSLSFHTLDGRRILELDPHGPDVLGAVVIDYDDQAMRSLGGERR